VSSVFVNGLDKRTFLLKKYDTLYVLANDMRSGKVDFNDFDDSDGIDPLVMNNSQV